MAFKVIALCVCSKHVFGKCAYASGMSNSVWTCFRFFRLEALFGLFPRPCGLHTSASQHNSNRTSIARIPRQKYARTYPVLLVRPDGSTIHIRYKEPRRILSVSEMLMGIDLGMHRLGHCTAVLPCSLS